MNTIKVGDTFDSFTEAELKAKEFLKCKFSKSGHNLYHVPSEMKKELVYHDVTFFCPHYGKPAKTKAKKTPTEGGRNRVSKKSNCPVRLYLVCDYEKKVLVVNFVEHRHNDHVPVAFSEQKLNEKESDKNTDSDEEIETGTVESQPSFTVIDKNHDYFSANAEKALSDTATTSKQEANPATPSSPHDDERLEADVGIESVDDEVQINNISQEIQKLKVNTEKTAVMQASAKKALSNDDDDVLDDECSKTNENIESAEKVKVSDITMKIEKLQVKNVEAAGIHLLENIQLPPLRKARGRPPGSNLTAIGTHIKKQPKIFIKRSKYYKKKAMLSWLNIDNQAQIQNILDGSYPLKMSDGSNYFLKDISDSFLSEEVDLNLLKPLMKPNVFSKFKQEVYRKRNENLYTCNICKEEAQDNTIFCDSCHKWYHYFCVNFTPETVPRDAWFCEQCCKYISINFKDFE